MPAHSQKNGNISSFAIVRYVDDDAAFQQMDSEGVQAGRENDGAKFE